MITPSFFRASLRATLEEADAFCLEVRRRLPSGSADGFAAELLAREAVTNAVVHGSRGDAALRVRCSLRVGRARLALRVTDQGPGFDWRGRSATASEVDTPGGRGLELYRAYAHRVLFNGSGNSILIIRNLSGATHE